MYGFTITLQQVPHMLRLVHVFLARGRQCSMSEYNDT